MNRRDFTKTVLAACGAGISAYGTVSGQETTFQKASGKKPFGVLYYEKACEIWDRESMSELPVLAEAADRAIYALRNGRKLYSHVIFGHMLEAEFRSARAGNPGYLPNWTRQTTDDSYNLIGKDDFLFFDYALPRVKAARDRGAFTVGIRVPYLPNMTIPDGALSPTYRLYGNVTTEECASLVLTPGVPFTDGVLYIPEIPAVRACPISVQGAGPLYWMLTAEIALRHRNPAVSGTAVKALEYITSIKERGEKIKSDIGHIDDTARFMVQSVINGGRYWTFSAGCEMAIENYIRASGLAMCLLLQAEDAVKNVKPGDFALIAGEFSDVRDNVEMARLLKSKGVSVISIGPAHTEGSSGDDLAREAKYHIETYSPERDGILGLPGFDKKLCPATGVLYALTLWMLNSQFIEQMIGANKTPGLYMGVHLMGGSEYNQVVRAIVDQRGY
ncbi:DUF2529 family protein [bacterium]|nr:DUF2529 family protein [bacterium]